MTERYEVRQTTTTGLLFAIYDREEKRLLTDGIFKRDAGLILSALNNLATVERERDTWRSLARSRKDQKLVDTIIAYEAELAVARAAVLALGDNLATAKAGLETIRKLGITHASEIARATLAAMGPEAGTPPA